MEQTADPFVTVFNKVIQQSMKSGNDGVLVECCHVFFTRTSKHHAEKHHGKPISVKVWCRMNEIESAEDPMAERKKLAAEYREKFNNPYYAASTGYVDDIIEPRESRPKIIASLSALRDKYAPAPPRKHGNIPV